MGAEFGNRRVDIGFRIDHFYIDEHIDFVTKVMAKAIITTRERALFSPILLEQLPEKDGLRLIKAARTGRAASLVRWSP